MRVAARSTRRLALGAALAAIAATAIAGCGDDPPERSTKPAEDVGPLTRSGAGNRFYEIYQPSGPVRGTMLLLHGGGWTDKRGDARRAMIVSSLAYLEQGWRVVNVSYTPPDDDGGKRPKPKAMLRDVVAFYDQVHKAFPGPVCAAGDSAGGHLAVMLALARPQLSCAVANGAPLDLIALSRESKENSELGREQLEKMFGTDRKDLRYFSPNRRWDSSRDKTPVFLMVASDDPYVPKSQAAGFLKADPGAKVEILKSAEQGDPGSVEFVHGPVETDSLQLANIELTQFLDGIAPIPSEQEPDDRVEATACDAAVPRADWARDKRDDRWKLLKASTAWKASAPEKGTAASGGCAGSGRWQDDGLSVWAFPHPTLTYERDTQASLTYSAPSSTPLRTVEASLRGFLARPADWDVGLYASTSDEGDIDTPVATCEAGTCRNLRLAPTQGGSAIASPDGESDPESVDEPPVQRIKLPAGTRRVAWRLICAAESGCPAPTPGPRERDPFGHPAILSIYRVTVR